MKDSIVISDATFDDIPGIREVSRLSWLATFPNEEHGVTKEDIEAKFAFKTEKDKEDLYRDRRSKMSDPTWHYWVAKKGEEVVGFCIARTGNTRNSLEAIHILQKYHHQGLGKELMKKALAWLGGEKDIELSVAVYNVNAISFYEKLGFKKTGSAGRDSETKLPSGVVVPQIEMVRKIKI